MHSAILLFFTLFSLALAAASVGDVPSDLVSRAEAAKKKKCATGIHLIAVRGNGNKGTVYGNVQPLVDSLLNAINGSTAEPVPYPKNETIRLANGPAVAQTTKEIEAYVKKCPKAKIVLAGYSEGAGIVSNTLCGTSSSFFVKTDPLPTQYTKNIIAAIVYSDGNRTPNESYDKGSCKGSGTFPRQDTAACAPYAPVLQSYCNSKDNFCCAGGSNKKSHYSYFRKYDKTVTKFVVKQFKKAQMAS